MKMAAAFIAWVLFICCSVTSYADQCILYARVGSDFTVPLKANMGSQLVWKHNDQTIFRKRDSTVHIGKKEDISNNGSLLLKNVTLDKQGKYQADIHDTEGKNTGTFSVSLCVIEPVKAPKLKMECIKSNSVKFTCETNPVEKGPTIRWYQKGNLLAKETGTSVTRLAESVKNDQFKCSVSNPVSEEFSNSVQQECRGIMDFLEDYMFILVGVGGGVVLLLFILVIICCIKAKRRRHMHLKDEEELRLGWTNPNQQHHHHHHHPNQQHHHHHHHRQQQKLQQPQQQQPQPQQQQPQPQQQQQPPQQRQQQRQQRQQPAGHTGPRPHRTKQQRQRHPDPTGANSQPSPRRPPQAPPAADEDQPPPLPQPRKKAPKTPQV